MTTLCLGELISRVQRHPVRSYPDAGSSFGQEFTTRIQAPGRGLTMLGRFGSLQENNDLVCLVSVCGISRQSTVSSLAKLNVTRVREPRTVWPIQHFTTVNASSGAPPHRELCHPVDKLRLRMRSVTHIDAISAFIRNLGFPIDNNPRMLG